MDNAAPVMDNLSETAVLQPLPGNIELQQAEKKDTIQYVFIVIVMFVVLLTIYLSYKQYRLSKGKEIKKLARYPKFFWSGLIAVILLSFLSTRLLILLSFFFPDNTSVEGFSFISYLLIVPFLFIIFYVFILIGAIGWILAKRKQKKLLNEQNPNNISTST